VELGLEDIEHGLELHVVGGGEDEVHLLLDDVVLGSLEVVAGLDFPLGWLTALATSCMSSLHAMSKLFSAAMGSSRASSECRAAPPPPPWAA
jgi:hypothetical protein